MKPYLVLDDADSVATVDTTVLAETGAGNGVTVV